MSLVTMTVPTMAFGWVLTAGEHPVCQALSLTRGGLIHALFPRLTFISALVISACVTPTDPVGAHLV